MNSTALKGIVLEKMNVHHLSYLLMDDQFSVVNTRWQHTLIRASQLCAVIKTQLNTAVIKTQIRLSDAGNINT